MERAMKLRQSYAMPQTLFDMEMVRKEPQTAGYWQVSRSRIHGRRALGRENQGLDARVREDIPDTPQQQSLAMPSPRQRLPRGSRTSLLDKPALREGYVLLTSHDAKVWIRTWHVQ
jgi:hypothetical protein